MLFVCFESLHRPHRLRVVSGRQLLPAEHLETQRGRIQFACVGGVERRGGVLNEYKVKTKKEKQKEENSSWTKVKSVSRDSLGGGGGGRVERQSQAGRWKRKHRHTQREAGDQSDSF